MVIHFIDWCFIVGFFGLTLGIGLAVARRAGTSTAEYFLSGRNMPWWLLGVSMVATTFSCDTPNLVTDIVRQNGVSGNWVWWAFLLTGMLTVFVYARLWRRSAVLTDLEFYELRYSGRSAAFLRGFRAIYLGVFFNIMIMAAVSLALIKIGGVMLDWSPARTLITISAITLIYSTLGGLRGVLITDFFQFIIAMIGAVGAAVIALNLPEVGGIQGLIRHPNVADKIHFFPQFSNHEAWITLLIIPLAVQWWSVWYPGSEPGGGGYVAQRMLSARNESNAMGATLLFNAAHYALRPWPWILVALASLIVFPDLASLRSAFPNIDPNVIQHDLAYPAMLTFLPPGLLGIMLASLIAAFMSTISTHLNWGSSYFVNDFYARFLKPNADQSHLVLVGRMFTVVLMLLTGLMALALENALQAFNILLQIGAGTGLLFILRWFWWRINAFSEITAMAVSFLIAIYFQILRPAMGAAEIPSHIQLLSGVLITTVCWLTVTYATQPSDRKTLISFCRLVRPGGPGWKKVEGDLEVSKPGEKPWEVPMGLVCMFLGCVAVYGALLGVGSLIYGQTLSAGLMIAVSVISSLLLVRQWTSLLRNSSEKEVLS